jgi:hypothetical protein
MTFINKFKYLGEKSPIFGKYSLHLNECYASAGDQSTLFTIFPLNFVPFMHYAG